MAKHKRLCRRLEGEDEPETPEVESSPTPNNVSNLYILEYSPKSFVVMGETLTHSQNLGRLGGKYGSYRYGAGWLFAKVREASVKKYIETGEVEPHVYTKEQREKFEQQKANSNSNLDLKRIFRELRSAFDPDEDYEGSAIIDVIQQIEDKY